MKQEQTSLFDNKKEDVVEEKVQKEEVILPKDENDEEVGVIDLKFAKKKKFRINNDSKYVLEIDTSDLGVISRFEQYYPKLKELEEKAQDIMKESTDSSEGFSKFAKKLKSLDVEMRKLLDEIFDANVSETCAPTGTMYDLINGTSRFEHIFSTISGLYEKNLTAETQKVKAKIAKYTNKYTH